jgi:hypothetical protein
MTINTDEVQPGAFSNILISIYFSNSGVRVSDTFNFGQFSQISQSFTYFDHLAIK